eukprot:CAMPEP_0113912452 /NCGR_PEP_ID=MMETSP0780_2-20120614/28933_1 /TAXON_ID=652834 /ORGANISM="Palpitomonas bilix" /LENGTH=216 /DNA_ID=CAMNT_0000909409 /DNA_START=196 /DNA_END=846 /DNA_ORIENTATION=+ /assembly_acc=CAM_ASM_000599
MCCCGKLIKYLPVLAGLVALFYYGIGHESQYIFDKELMLEVSQAGIEHGQGDMNRTIEFIRAELVKKFPNNIFKHSPWIFNNAGGAMGTMLVLHCSLSEYVIIFGSALGTEGHTGRFWADDYFTILQGEQWAQKADSFEKEVYKAGEQHHLPRGVAKQYRMPDTCWALEYARGNIISMLPFGFMDGIFSTIDFYTVGQTVFYSAWSMGENLLNGKI